MWQCGFLILLAIISSNAETKLDINYTCRNTRPGDVIPNPLDCASYFICGDDLKATLSQCGSGLHFDATRKVCNWPDRANCKFGVTVFPVFPETANPNDHQSKPPTIDLTTHTTTDLGGWNDMRLTFAAFSVATGQIIHPMFGYDPQRVQCIHRGAYFLPHPRNCQRYFMCAFGHLLPHECGRGTVWSYKRQHCEIASDPTAECYATLFGDVTTPTADPTIGTETITTSTPEYLPTVCYPVYTSGGTTVTWQPTGTTLNPTGTTWNSTGKPTDTTWHPTGTTWRPTTDTTLEPAVTATTAKKSDDSSIICSEGVKYLADAEDCAHYFICIQEIPVGMFCPEGSFWDYQGEFCTTHVKVQCLNAISTD